MYGGWREGWFNGFAEVPTQRLVGNFEEGNRGKCDDLKTFEQYEADSLHA